jgi:hypothetical protein
VWVLTIAVVMAGGSVIFLGGILLVSAAMLASAFVWQHGGSYGGAFFAGFLLGAIGLAILVGGMAATVQRSRRRPNG